VTRARELLDSAGHRHEFTPTLTEAIAAALAEEREKARARIASDLTDLVTDSMNGGDRDDR
jgi:hypothetical protein